MLKKEFSEWLEKKYSNKGTIQSRLSNVERIDDEYDLDYLYAKDECQNLWERFQYNSKDSEEGKLPNVNVDIKGDYVNGMATLRSALKLYITFLGEECNQSYIQKLKSTSNRVGVVFFKGNLSDFKHYIGGYCRNMVNGLAKKERDSRNGICEWCGQKKVLQSAHRTGEERVAIIENILETHFKKGPDYYEVDLIVFEDLFAKKQTPILEHFFFLCSDCHNSYDGKSAFAGVITTADLISKRAVKP